MSYHKIDFAMCVTPFHFQYISGLLVHIQFRSEVAHTFIIFASILVAPSATLLKS